MKLKDSYLTPIGGYKFEYDVGLSERFPSGVIFFQKNDSSGLSGFVKYVRSQMVVNSIAIPENLSDLIEDYICTYQPPERCRYTSKLGDQISKGIIGVTKIIDTVAGTKLTKKARGCRSCSRRRTKLNK